MKEKMMQFMAGRNGNDALNRFLLILDLIILLLGSIFNRAVGFILMPLALVLIGWTYFRMLSRNLVRRAEENARYLRLMDRVRSQLRVLRERWLQRKDFKFFTCPVCRAAMRVPKGKGKVQIVCRKCGNKFTGKT